MGSTCDRRSPERLFEWLHIERGTSTPVDTNNPAAPYDSRLR